MITRIEAYNYRCFDDLGIDLSGFHVLAGANGSGKSTLLDIPVLLRDMLDVRQAEEAFLRPSRSTGRPPRALSLAELTHCGRDGGFGFALEARLPGEVAGAIGESSSRDLRFPVPTHLRYELHLDPVGGAGIEITGEYLVLFHEDEPVGRIDPAEAAGDPDEVRVTRGGRTVERERWEHSWRPVIAGSGGAGVRFTSETGRQEQMVQQGRRGSLALASVPFDALQFPAALWFQHLLESGAVLFAPDWSALRQAAPPAGRDPQLDTQGRTTPWLALGLRREEPEVYDAWVDLVRLALPQVEAVEVVEREEDRFAYFRVTYTGGYQVTSSGLSDGTLRVLALTLLPYLDSTPPLLLTEEPENGIYPQAIETVMGALRTVRGSQVLVATQSPLVLAQVDLAEVLATRMNPDTGAVTVVRGDRHPRMADWRAGLDELDLGTLFATGVFE